ncbi:MAG: thioredoxin [Lysobacteraceae bacterium]
MTQTAPSPHSFDATTADFEQSVLVRSTTVPVLIDFWAPWCAPCRQLKPILEKLADEYNGAFVLAKVNSDEEMQVASLFGVRSLPTVILLKDGQPVDGFMGAQPESALRQFLAQHGITPAAGEAEAAPQTLVDEPPQARAARLREELALAAGEAGKEDELKLDLALTLAQLGEADEARQLLDALPDTFDKDDRVLRARATLGFAAQLKGAPTAAELAKRLYDDADDHAARHLLGVHALVAGDYEAALEQLLELLRRERGFEDGLPRRALIDAFAVIDDEDLVGRYRRRMASVLF